MAKALTPAQRKAVAGSDPSTGRLSARADVCAALVAAGLAVPHGRSGHPAYYLSQEGLRQRAALAAAEAARQAAREAEAAAEPPAVPVGTFTADDGTGTVTPGRGPARAAEVAAAWEGLLGIRAVLLDGVTDVPAPWERERLVHAVSLALEAAGCPPAPDGYTVTPSAQDGAVEVSWRGAAAPDEAAGHLGRCAALLDARGWQSTRHRDRAARPFLLTSPRRSAPRR
ncbi:hypothetical protein ACIOC1_17885 [Streptomyces sp. NPDC088197]|uniref:hypothetical protein n=1 Tax=Streptomyces sp. NPDC088197 TaxID=3365840 RepID=UPI00380311DF